MHCIMYILPQADLDDVVYCSIVTVAPVVWAGMATTETYIVGVEHLSADQQALLDQTGEWLVKTIQELPQQ